jgi:hypothetical protein
VVERRDRVVTHPRLLPLVLVWLSTLTWNGCGSKSPTAPSAPSSDLAAQFDSLWTTFDREYSYFVHKQIDWGALRSVYRPQATAAADQTGFIAVIREMLGHLHDMHVVIRDPGGRSTPTYDPRAFVNWDRPVWEQYIARANWTQGQNDWGYGMLEGVPYFAIGSWGATSIRSVDFDGALERVRTAPAIILDVRMNPGGNDALAFEVAGRFTATSVVFGFVRFRNGPLHSDFGPPTARTLSPRGSWQYAGTVLVLIGRRSASSNESFIAAMGQLPNVTLVGDRTAGSTGNPGTFPLGNGWSYTVSRWIEYTVDGQPIEDVGISPDVLVATGPEDFGMGRDPVLEWALKAVSR